MLTCLQHTILPIIRSAQTRVDMDVTVRWLSFKPDRQERARARGALEMEGNFLTLETTKQLVKLVFNHVSRSVRTRQLHGIAPTECV